ncbi:MAG: HAD family hydrolase [Chloroflexi bacterium]|nr:HAD family hydrolase [Chloroflexota bacterium]
MRGRRAVLFDFDGTLIHQTIDFARMRRLAEDVVRSYGLSIDAWQGMFVLEMIELAAAQLGEGADHRAQEMRARAHQAIVDLELAAAVGAQAFDGVVQMLADLRERGVRVAIVTRNCRPAVEAVMAQNQLSADVLLTRDDVAHVKPDPRHLYEALGRLGISGTQAAMVGDHPSDVQVGQAVGAATVGVLSPGLGPERFAAVRPDLLVQQVTEILQYL